MGKDSPHTDTDIENPLAPDSVFPKQIDGGLLHFQPKIFIDPGVLLGLLLNLQMICGDFLIIDGVVIIV
jgi:hypothetical protein